MTKARILLIEDEKRIREMVKEYLESEDFEVYTAKDGAEGMEMFNSEIFDTVLLDVMLPKIDGWTVCREIRHNSDIPIIMLTARGEEYDRLFGFELGVDDYVTKPFSPKELAARIKAVLRRTNKNTSNKAENEVFKFNNLLVDIDARKVVIDGKNISMTPKEFDLLSFFVKNMNKVFTREQLLDKVWGYEFGGDYRTVDTHVKMLRESLGQYRSIIVTAWGVGYKLEIGG